MTRKPLFTSLKKAVSRTGAAIIVSAVTLTGLTASPQLFAQPASISDDAGQVYTVKSGDGLYKLGREFFGKGSDYKKIVKAHNAKAVTDSRFQTIDPNKGLSVGQLIWIPAKKANIAPNGTNAQSVRQLRDNAAKSNKQVIPSSSTPSTTSSSSTNKAVSEDTLATDYSIPKPRKSDESRQANANSKEDPAYVVTPPKTNCEIRIWYNFQIVAIKQLNERWKAEGLSVVERAKKAFQIRHDARLNGRYMMKDRFEVAALRDRDNKKYGNPDGPTFEHMVAFGRENGLTGDRVYEGIIESSARVQPVYKSSCVK